LAPNKPSSVYSRLSPDCLSCSLCLELSKTSRRSSLPNGFPQEENTPSIQHLRPVGSVSPSRRRSSEGLERGLPRAPTQDCMTVQREASAVSKHCMTGQPEGFPVQPEGSLVQRATFPVQREGPLSAWSWGNMPARFFVEEHLEGRGCPTMGRPRLLRRTP
jgi:hypothetical protein